MANREVTRSDIGVGRPVTSAIAGGDIFINVNSGAVGSTHLVMEALLRAVSTDAWITCHDDDGWDNLICVASGETVGLGYSGQMGSLREGLLIFKLGSVLPGTLNDRSVFVSPFDTGTAALARSWLWLLQ